MTSRASSTSMAACARSPRHLIVTDKDFGRAYLRDAWAARFLERMFASFTVLFIGYSHDDVVMRYLARSLGRQSGRYVLTSDPDASKWRPLGIEPIAYEVRASSHAALTRAISGWAGLLSMGLLDHRQQIARLVAAARSSIPEEQSYLSPRSSRTCRPSSRTSSSSRCSPISRGTRPGSGGRPSSRNADRSSTRLRPGRRSRPPSRSGSPSGASRTRRCRTPG